MTPELPFIESLRERVRKHLPGPSAQQLMSPQFAYGRHRGPPSWDTQRAAVILLLTPDGLGHWAIPLTVRPKTMSKHAGQISLPGGAADDGESYEECALRELQEELGVAVEIHILGRLSPIFVFNTNFFVMPILAVAPSRPDYHPNPLEVETLLELPTSQLLNPQCQGKSSITRGSLHIEAPHFALGKHRIWGATSMILSEFRGLLRQTGTGSSLN